jgi:hypothetical protein
MGTPGAWAALSRAHSQTCAPRDETWRFGCSAYALGPQIIVFFSINTFNNNKNNNFCTTNNNIFYISTLKCNTNKYYYLQL